MNWVNPRIHGDKMHIEEKLCVSIKEIILGTLCFLRECRAFLMVSYSSACSASVMARKEESVFNLSSFIAAQRKELQSQGEGRACLA